jgi:hypothetical protein
VSGPPGHNKLLPPPSRPCDAADDRGHGTTRNGIVFALPLGLGSLLAGVRARVKTRRGRR